MHAMVKLVQKMHLGKFVHFYAVLYCNKSGGDNAQSLLGVLARLGYWGISAHKLNLVHLFLFNSNTLADLHGLCCGTTPDFRGVLAHTHIYTHTSVEVSSL